MTLLTDRQIYRKSFWKGFWNGVASPGLIYQKPVEMKRPSVFYITVPGSSVKSALLGDWAKVGGDLRKVVTAHGKANKPSKKFISSKRRQK